LGKTSNWQLNAGRNSVTYQLGIYVLTLTTNGTYVRGFVQIIKSFLGVGITKSAIVFGTLLLNCNYKLTSVGRQKERVTKATSKAKPKIRD